MTARQVVKMWAFIESINGTLLVIVGILGSFAIITRNLRSGFKATNNFIKRQKEESETIFQTKARVDRIENTLGNIEKNLQAIRVQCDVDRLERVKHNIISFSAEIKNGVEQPEAQYQYILEKCDWYEKENHNGYVKPHILAIREAYKRKIEV